MVYSHIQRLSSEPMLRRSLSSGPDGLTAFACTGGIALTTNEPRIVTEGILRLCRLGSFA